MQPKDVDGVMSEGMQDNRTKECLHFGRKTKWLAYQPFDDRISALHKVAEAVLYGVLRWGYFRSRG